MDLAKCVVPHTGTLRDALLSLESSGVQMVLVLEKSVLIGIATDGDLRRGMLAGLSLDARITRVMKSDFVSVHRRMSRSNVLELMQARGISAVPIVDKSRHPEGLHLLLDVIGGKERPNAAVVMAGGKGTRLGALTTNIPKPMLPVAGRPILERTVLHLVGHGIRRIFISVNYLAEVVMHHFGDGSDFGCKIEYLQESTPLGTGGALSLLPSMSEAVVVMNGDLITQFDVGALLDFHEAGTQAMTVGSRRYLHRVPFGCFESDGDKVIAVVEKPLLAQRINAGVYVISPGVLAHVPSGEEYPLPTLIEQCLLDKLDVCLFELDSDWIDVGLPEQLRQARGEV